MSSGFERKKDGGRRMNKRAEEHGAEEPKEERNIGRERKERRKMRDRTTCGRRRDEGKNDGDV